MQTPPHLDPALSEDERAARRADLRQRFADLPFDLEDVHLDNYIDGEFRQADPTDPVGDLDTPEISAVGAGDLDDVIAFFDHDAFAGKPEWSACYCQCHHASDFGHRSWVDNRADLIAGLSSGRFRAMIARVDGRVVGWLNCSDRSTSPDHATGSDAGVASILCWAIAPAWRGRGLGRALLDGAIDHLRSTGINIVEGYPIEEPSDAWDAYHGPVELFAKCGFETVDRNERSVTVRRRLTK